MLTLVCNTALCHTELITLLYAMRRFGLENMSIFRCNMVICSTEYISFKCNVAIWPTDCMHLWRSCNLTCDLSVQNGNLLSGYIHGAAKEWPPRNVRPTAYVYFPNSEILFDFNEGSSRVFRIYMMLVLVRGRLLERGRCGGLSYVIDLLFEK